MLPNCYPDVLFPRGGTDDRFLSSVALCRGTTDHARRWSVPPGCQCCTISPMPLHESQVPARLARRSFLFLAAAVPALAQTQPRDWTNQQTTRYPDPDIVVLDRSFAKYQLFNAVIYRHYVGTKWAEGPAWCAQDSTCDGATFPTTGNCESRKRTGTSAFSVARRATATGTPSISKAGNWPASTPAGASCATSTMAL